MTNPSRRFRLEQRTEQGAVLLAMLGVGLWLWMCWCLFPSRGWNDVRLAPAFGLQLGVPLYGGSEGLASTWMYGPLPVLVLWPATWAPSAAAALVLAGTLNLLTVALAIIAVCAVWPAVSGRPSPSRRMRLAAAMAAIMLWPGAVWQYLQADNLAVAIGLLANLALVAAPSPAGRWGAALLGSAALFCKQISLGVPLAQLLWIGTSIGWKPASHHALRLFASGLVWLTVFLAGQDPAAAWFNLILVPSALPWTDAPWQRLYDLWPHLAVQLGLPIGVWFWLRRTAFRRGLLLPTLTWLCSLPFGLAGLLKVGGSLNNLQGFPLWLPPALVVVAQAAQAARPQWRLQACAGLLVAGIALGRILLLPALVLQPAVELAQQGEQLARTAPGRIWFPWSPLMTVYAEHRLYHVEDGLYVRQISGRPVGEANLRRGLPEHMAFVALPQRSTDWGLALSLLTGTRQAHDVGYWRLHSNVPAATAR